MAGRKDTSGVQRLTSDWLNDWLHSTKRSQHSGMIPAGSLCERKFCLRYAGHIDTEMVFLCATSCLNPQLFQWMFYFNFLRVFQGIVMSHIIWYLSTGSVKYPCRFANFESFLPLLLHQIKPFIYPVNKTKINSAWKPPHKTFAVVLFL